MPLSGVNLTITDRKDVPPSTRGHAPSGMSGSLSSTTSRGMDPAARKDSRASDGRGPPEPEKARNRVSSGNVPALSAVPFLPGISALLTPGSSVADLQKHSHILY
jgi:hypothetical protein